MNKLIAVTALTLMCGSAFAQNTGAPANQQTDMNKPGMNNMEKGSMKKEGMSGTSGMSSDNKGKPNKEMSKEELERIGAQAFTALFKLILSERMPDRIKIVSPSIFDHVKFIERPNWSPDFKGISDAMQNYWSNLLPLDEEFLASKFKDWLIKAGFDEDKIDIIDSHEAYMNPKEGEGHVLVLIDRHYRGKFDLDEEINESTEQRTVLQLPEANLFDDLRRLGYSFMDNFISPDEMAENVYSKLKAHIEMFYSSSFDFSRE